MVSFKEDVSTAVGKVEVVGFLHFEELTFESRSRFLEQKFICDLGMEPQSETFTVIFKLPDILIGSAAETGFK